MQTNALERTAPLKPTFAAANTAANEKHCRDLAAQVKAEMDLVEIFEEFRRWYVE